MDNQIPYQTTGTLSASIGYFDEHFEGSSDFAIVKYPERFYVKARMDLPDGNWRYISMYLPASIPDDGSKFDLSLVMNPDLITQARANYEQFSPEGGNQWGSASGQLRMSYNWKTAQMEGDFQFESRAGSPAIEVSAGEFDLTGITDGVKYNGTLTGSGTFQAASQEWGPFNADVVSIEYKEIPFDPVGYWEIVGRMSIDDAIPPTQSHIALFIKTNVEGKEHQLKDNNDVWVTYFRPDHGGFFQAIKGSLSFKSLPGTGHAEGTLIAYFNEEGKDILVNGEFHIEDNVPKF
ncbi:hypothetical protein KVG95_09265 [Pseudomonas sp. SWRI79]|uniref:Uncharacterized protein n=1 Tax=Pseudomonas farris TaxID=2841207 RepID=A0ABS6PU11_9PSED|nr:hypothetical protein [Pseudomonas farris]MBV4463526.1 hypothetical protein [Pseudomonas farris]